MFFLVPRVALGLFVVFSVLLAWRAWRQRHGPRLPQRTSRRARRRRSDGSLPLVPAALLQGADRTWVVFTTRECKVCRRIAARLRAAEPSSQVAEVDAAREPRLVEAYGIPRLPAVLLANRYGQVEARLVGLRAIDDYTG
jgi:hypothetical protein